MPRYFFNRLDGGFEPDTEGVQCPGIQAARLEAVEYAASTIRSRPDIVWAGGEMRILVSDEQGALVTTIVIRAEDPPKG